jgi:uncharacterized ion transporter superfamily protein YfcC
MKTQQQQSEDRKNEKRGTAKQKYLVLMVLCGKFVVFFYGSHLPKFYSVGEK